MFLLLLFANMVWWWVSKYCLPILELLWPLRNQIQVFLLFLDNQTTAQRCLVCQCYSFYMLGSVSCISEKKSTRLLHVVPLHVRSGCIHRKNSEHFPNPLDVCFAFLVHQYFWLLHLFACSQVFKRSYFCFIFYRNFTSMNFYFEISPFKVFLGQIESIVVCAKGNIITILLL